MARIDETAAEQAVGGAALKEGDPKAANEAVQELQKQTIVYDIPKEWIRLIKSGAAATTSGYMKQALREKLVRDGHLK